MSVFMYIIIIDNIPKNEIRKLPGIPVTYFTNLLTLVSLILAPGSNKVSNTSTKTFNTLCSDILRTQKSHISINISYTKRVGK